jgi:hypothetical protein
MMEALRSSETTDLTRATRRNIPEDASIHIFLSCFQILPRSLSHNTLCCVILSAVSLASSVHIYFIQFPLYFCIWFHADFLFKCTLMSPFLKLWRSSGRLRNARPRFITRSGYMTFVVEKVARGRFCEYSGYLTNCRSSNCSTVTPVMVIDAVLSRCSHHRQTSNTEQKKRDSWYGQYKIQIVPHRKHITPPLQSTAG